MKLEFNLNVFLILALGCLFFFLYRLKNTKSDVKSELTVNTAKFTIGLFLQTNWFDILVGFGICAIYALIGKDLKGNALDYTDVVGLLGTGFMAPIAGILVLENFVGLSNKSKKNLRTKRKL